MSITALRRTSVVLLVAALCVAAGYAALEAVSGTPAVASTQGGEVTAPRADQEAPEIGTAILLTRNADGSITTTER